MAPDKLAHNDPRVENKTATVNGREYYYQLGKPQGTPKGTVLLVHGFPDLSYGWRFQVPFLLSQGYQVIVPDQLGYGRSARPQELEPYSSKSMSADMIEIANQVVGTTEKIILGGHDWGGFLVWRIVLWHPERIAGVFSVCTPYTTPIPQYVPLEMLTKIIPSFSYQTQLAGPEVEEKLQGRDNIRLFINAIFGGRTKDGAVGFDSKTGVLFENLPNLAQSPLISSEDLDYYADEHARGEGTLRGPLNWYRVRKINYEEEMELVNAGKGHVAAPALMVTATKDTALPPSMAEGMDSHFDSLIVRQVDATHWALTQAADAVNAAIKEFLDSVVKGAEPKASI